MDVKGKIVLMDSEVPLGAADTEAFRKWRPYSFHQYKLENAVSPWGQGHDLQLRSDRESRTIPTARDSSTITSGRPSWPTSSPGRAGPTPTPWRKIRKELKPQSFATGKIMTVKNVTEHHPEGVG